MTIIVLIKQINLKLQLYAVKPFQSILLVVFVALAAITSYSIIQYKPPTEEDSLKATLLAESLKIGFIGERLPDHRFIMDDPIIYVSSENLEGIPLPKDLGLNFLKTTPEELQRIANKNGDFMYVYINEIALSPRPYVEVMTMFQKAEGSQHMYLAGGLMGVEFKFNGTSWEGTVVKWWIS